jgi:hypothetical protein
MKNRFFDLIRKNQDLILIFASALAIRALIVFFGLFIWGSNQALYNKSDFSYPEKLVNAWVQWDAHWYLDILDDGYDKDFPQVQPDDPLCHNKDGYCQRDFAFFPVYPLTVFAVKSITGINADILGIAISNMFFVFAVIGLYLLVKEIYNPDLAKYSAIAMMVYPVGYVFSGMMSESIFIFLLIIGYYAAYKKHWIVAGVIGAILSATRIVGILIIFSYLLLYLEQNNFKIVKSVKFYYKVLIAIAMSFVGIVGYMIYLQYHLGEPLAFLMIQNYWEKSTANLNPLFAIPFALIDYRVEGSMLAHFYNFGFLVLATTLFVWSSIKKILPMSLNIILLWFLIPMTSGTMLALSRYISVEFPIYILLGVICFRYPKYAPIILSIMSLLLGLMVSLYVSGNFIAV